MNHGTCKHFNGIQNEKCQKGIIYNDAWPSSPMPCIKVIHKNTTGGTYLKPGELPASSYKPHANDTIKPCQFYEEPTDEEVQASRRDEEEMLQKTDAAIKVSTAWRSNPKPDRDRYGIVECPICKGKLRLIQSSYNGHVHGRCETPNCVSWME